MARGACGPRARNSPRRPARPPKSPPRGRPARPRAPRRAAPRPHPGREPPVESRNRARARRGPARGAEGGGREDGGGGGGKPPGFPEEGLGAWRRGGRCQRGVGAGPKQKLGHAPRGILGANSLIGGACCCLPWQAVSPQDSASRARVCVRACVCRASGARPGVARGHGDDAGPGPHATPRARRAASRLGTRPPRSGSPASLRPARP